MKKNTYNPAFVYLSSLNSPVSVRNRTFSLNYLCRLIDGSNIKTFNWSDFDYVSLLNIRQKLIDKGLLSSSINTHICALKSVCFESWNLNLISTDCYMKIKNIKPVRGKSKNNGRALNIEELRSIIEYKPNNNKSVRDSAIIALGYGSGLRISEIAKLNVEECQHEKVRVHGKGGLICSVFIPTFARNVLNQWLDVLNRNKGAVFCCMARGDHIRDKRISTRTIHDIIETRCNDIGLAKFSPHDLRRSFGTHLLNSGVDLLIVQKLMRHSNVNTTKIYDMRGESAEKEAIEMLPF